MLGAVSANPTVPRNKISYPPKEEQLSADGLRDWKVGHELLKTCLATHETVTYVFNPLLLPKLYLTDDFCYVFLVDSLLRLHISE